MRSKLYYIFQNFWRIFRRVVIFFILFKKNIYKYNILYSKPETSAFSANLVLCFSYIRYRKMKLDFVDTSLISAVSLVPEPRTFDISPLLLPAVCFGYFLRFDRRWRVLREFSDNRKLLGAIIDDSNCQEIANFQTGWTLNCSSSTWKKFVLEGTHCYGSKDMSTVRQIFNDFQVK